MGKAGKRYKVEIRSNGIVWEGKLEAYWEVELDPISDDYDVEDASAIALFYMWKKRVMEKYPDGLIPIHWFVQSTEAAKFEYFPFQYEHLHSRPQEDFLTFYDWPADSVTGERVNWFELPVVNKLWNKKQADKGGFIQEATGWKPSILQPFVYLPALESALL